MIEKTFCEKIFYFKIYRKQDFKELGEHYQYTHTIRKACKKMLEEKYGCQVLSRLHIIYHIHKTVAAEDFLLEGTIDIEEKSKNYYVEE